MTVLVLVTVLSTLAGSILAISVFQRRYMNQDLQRLRAFYAAEGGLHSALPHLVENVKGGMLEDAAFERTYRIDSLASAHVTGDVIGGFAYLTSTGSSGKRRTTIRATVAGTPNVLFDNAIVVGDSESVLVLSDVASITGNIAVGRGGVETAALQGRRFRGSHQGIASATDTIALPRLNTGGMNRLMQVLEQIRNSNEDEITISGWGAMPIMRIGEDHSVVSQGNSLEVAAPAIITGVDRLRITDDTWLSNRTIVVGRTVHLSGTVHGRDLIVYASDSLLIDGTASVSGQFIGRHHVRIGGKASMAYPSLVYAEGRDEPVEHETNVVVEITENAWIDGTVILADLGQGPNDGRGQRRAIVGRSATVRGSILSYDQLELHGHVEGTALTSSFYLYSAPTHYTNWLTDATIDVQRRPSPYSVPIGVEGTMDLRIVSQEEL